MKDELLFIFVIACNIFFSSILYAFFNDKTTMIDTALFALSQAIFTQDEPNTIGMDYFKQLNDKYNLKRKEGEFRNGSAR